MRVIIPFGRNITLIKIKPRGGALLINVLLAFRKAPEVVISVSIRFASNDLHALAFAAHRKQSDQQHMQTML